MPVYSRPDVYAVETTQSDGPIRGAALGYGAMLAKTEKGPVGGKVVRTRTFDAWQRVFGGYQTSSDAAYEAKMFFDEGGNELLTARVCNYTDLDDPASFTGVAAKSKVYTEGVAATAATKTAAAGPYVMSPGLTVVMETDNGGTENITFSATEASITDTTSYPVLDQNGLTTIFSINGVSQTVTYPASTTLPQAVEDAINDQLTGINASVSGGQIVINTDKKGTDASISVTGGTSVITWAAPVASTGNVGDILDVQTSEVIDIFNAASDSVSTINPNGSFTITSPTTGSSSELDFQSGTALTILGLTVEVIVGTDLGATYDTLLFEAGYHGYKSPGTAGNNLSRKIIHNPKRPSAGLGNDLAADASATDTSIQVNSTKGIGPKSLIKIWDSSNIEYFEVDDVRTVVTGSTVEFYIDIVGSLSNGYTAASSQLQSLEFGVEIYESGALVEDRFNQMSTLDTADNYFVTLINDENTGSEYVIVTDYSPTPPGIGADLPAEDSSPVQFTTGASELTGISDADWVGTETGRTGIHAFDTVREYMPFCTPGNNSAVLFHSAAAYAKSRMWFEYIGYVNVGTSATNAVAYRETTLGIDSSYASLYSGGVQVFDPVGVGSNPKRSIPGVGGLMGLRSRVDSLPSPNGGPWNAPAGEGDYGTLYTALDVATDYSESEMGILNDAHINVIKKFGNTSPVLVWGARTLDASVQQRYRYINTRRFFSYVEKSVVDSTRWAVFRNNDFRLWSSLKDRVDRWLSNLMTLRAFPTDIKDLAFYVKVGITDGVMTSADKDAGYVRGKIGLAPQKAGEFVEWTFAQYASGYDAEEV